MEEDNDFHFKKNTHKTHLHTLTHTLSNTCESTYAHAHAHSHTCTHLISKWTYQAVEAGFESESWLFICFIETYEIGKMTHFFLSTSVF